MLDAARPLGIQKPRDLGRSAFAGHTLAARAEPGPVPCQFGP